MIALVVVCAAAFDALILVFERVVKASVSLAVMADVRRYCRHDGGIGLGVFF